jgi:hypothetical protein
MPMESVLEQDVGGVLGAGQPRLERGEAQVHDEHQARAQHHPDVVGGELTGRDPVLREREAREEQGTCQHRSGQ